MIIASFPILKSKRFYSFLLIHHNKAHFAEKEIWTVNCIFIALYTRRLIKEAKKCEQLSRVVFVRI